jgi:hypothetical protein
MEMVVGNENQLQETETVHPDEGRNRGNEKQIHT